MFRPATLLLAVLVILACALTGCGGGSGSPVGADSTPTMSTEAAPAPNHWVSPTGNDSNPGTEALPWKTIRKAAAVVVPGDVVLVLPGSYQGFYVERSGTKDKPIIFRGQSNRDCKITATNGRTPDGINVENCNYVTIQNFTVNNMPRTGIRAAVADHISILGCRCQNNQTWGILTGFCNYLIIQSNICSGSKEQHGIYVGNSGDYPIVRYNTCFNNRGCGIHCNADASMGGDGIISHALFDSNIIYNNGLGGGSGINCDGVTDSKIVNNLLYNNHASGISLYQIDGATGSARNRVINNTVVQAPDGRWALNINTGSTGAIVRNNILLHTLTYRGSITVDASSLSGFSSDYNLCSGPFSPDGDSTLLSLAQWQGRGYDAHSAIATAAQIFNNPGAANYRPLSPGPAIDKGQAQYAPALDILKRPRPAGAADDIGCYEGR